MPLACTFACLHASWRALLHAPWRALFIQNFWSGRKKKIVDFKIWCAENARQVTSVNLAQIRILYLTCTFARQRCAFSAHRISEGSGKKNERIRKPRAPDDEFRRASCRSSCSAPPRFFGKLACINARQLACTSAHQPYGGWGGGGGLRTGSLWDGRGDGSRGSRNGWKCGGTDFGGVVGGVVAAGMKRARLGRNGLWRGREVYLC